MNHYCTYFDSRYTLPGCALWLSLRRHDPAAVLWVLALDEGTAEILNALADPKLRVVPLAVLEAADTPLVASRTNRTRTEYVFTLSPCWPRFLLARHPEIEVVTYLDADTALFSSPSPLFSALGANSVLIVEHRFPDFLRGLEERGRFNVGVLCFRNDVTARSCLDDWRARCLAWCRDVVEPDRYADQKYLDAWPRNFAGVVVCSQPGVNLAPWNWMSHRYTFRGDTLLVDEVPLMIFHFARFRPRGPRRAESGQLEYGIMPLRLRTWIYGRYWTLLAEARSLLRAAPAAFESASVAREHRAAWKGLLLAALFGPVWWKVGPWWVSGRFGLGRFSGRAVHWLRRNLSRRGAGAK